MEITIINKTVEKKWSNNKKLFTLISDRTSKVLNLSNSECLSVIFVDSKMIQEINREYRNIDKPTDVISFALNDSDDDFEIMDGESELGDIFINVEYVYKQAIDYDHTIKRETAFLFTHGLLHLLGYDHMQKEDEEKMIQLQDVILDEIVKR